MFRKPILQRLERIALEEIECRAHRFALLSSFSCSSCLLWFSFSLFILSASSVTILPSLAFALSSEGVRPVLFVSPQQHIMLDQAQREPRVALLAASLRRRAAQRDKEPDGDVLRHSSMELASYGDPSHPKSLLLLQLGLVDKSYFFGHTQWRRARKNKRTAHGGKAAVATPLSGAGRRDASPTNSRPDTCATRKRAYRPPNQPNGHASTVP